MEVLGFGEGNAINGTLEVIDIVTLLRGDLIKGLDTSHEELFRIDGP